MSKRACTVHHPEAFSGVHSYKRARERGRGGGAEREISWRLQSVNCKSLAADSMWPTSWSFTWAIHNYTPGFTRSRAPSQCVRGNKGPIYYTLKTPETPYTSWLSMGESARLYLYSRLHAQSRDDFFERPIAIYLLPPWLSALPKWYTDESSEDFQNSLDYVTIVLPGLFIWTIIYIFIDDILIFRCFWYCWEILSVDNFLHKEWYELSNLLLSTISACLLIIKFSEIHEVIKEESIMYSANT